MTSKGLQDQVLTTQRSKTSLKLSISNFQRGITWNRSDAALQGLSMKRCLTMLGQTPLISTKWYQSKTEMSPTRDRPFYRQSRCTRRTPTLIKTPVSAQPRTDSNGRLPLESNSRINNKARGLNSSISNTLTISTWPKTRWAQPSRIRMWDFQEWTKIKLNRIQSLDRLLTILHR